LCFCTTLTGNREGHTPFVRQQDDLIYGRPPVSSSLVPAGVVGRWLVRHERS